MIANAFMASIYSVLADPHRTTYYVNELLGAMLTFRQKWSC